MILINAVANISHHFAARAAEWATSIMLFRFGMVLLDPSPTFDGQAYAELARIASEAAWGWTCLLVGGARLIALTINGSMRQSPMVRAWAAGLSALFWLQITVGFYMAAPDSTAMAIYPVLLCLDGYNAIRAAGDAGAVSRRGR